MLARNLNDFYIADFIERELQAGVAKAGSLLDVGCGKSPYREFHERICSHVVGLDIERRSGATSVIGVADRLPFSAGTFDVVVCSEVIEHLPEPGRALSEMVRVLKPGGKLILTWPFMYGLHELPHDYSRPTEFAIVRTLSESGVAVTVMRRRGGVIGLVYTILADHLVAAASRAGEVIVLLKPVSWVIVGMMKCLNRFVAWVSMARTPRGFSSVGEGLSGARGALRRWHLGYCLAATKQGRDCSCV